MAALDKLIGTAQAKAVFGEPVSVGEHTVITAAEVSVGLGFGFGGGANPPQQCAGDAEAPQIQGIQYSAGGGGGGGGVAGGRPVAVVHIGPEGVRIDPVLDVTKVSLALFAALGALFVMLGRLSKARRRK